MKLVQPDSSEKLTPQERELIRVIRRMTEEDSEFVFSLIERIGNRNISESAHTNPFRLVIGGLK